jgi:hypothetical protein
LVRRLSSATTALNDRPPDLLKARALGRKAGVPGPCCQSWLSSWCQL